MDQINKKEDESEEIMSFYELLKQFIIDSINNSGYCTQLLILQANVEKFYQNKKLQSLYTIWQINNNLTAIFEQFEMFCFLYILYI